jgi:hypothetical protein
MIEVEEHVLYNYLKLVYVCDSTSGKGEAIGDLPGWPFCFKESRSHGINDGKVVWSDWIELDDEEFSVRFSGAKVFGKLLTVNFQARGINCKIRPEELFRRVRAIINDLCGKRVIP